MKTIRIISKRDASKMLVASLFAPVNGKTLNKMKYDNGKYEWRGSQKDYIGTEHKVFDNVHALYVERRTNNDGVYCQVMCIFA